MADGFGNMEVTVDLSRVLSVEMFKKEAILNEDEERTRGMEVGTASVSISDTFWKFCHGLKP